MEKLVNVFRPYIDADPDLDILWSSKLGWVCVDNSGSELWSRIAKTKVELMSIISSWLFDRAESDIWSDCCADALEAMDPILALLPEEDRAPVEEIMSLYRRFEEELDNL